MVNIGTSPFPSLPATHACGPFARMVGGWGTAVNPRYVLLRADSICQAALDLPVHWTVYGPNRWPYLSFSTFKGEQMRRSKTSGAALGSILFTLAIVLMILVFRPSGRDGAMAKQSEGMGDMAASDGTPIAIPPVDGFYAGQPIQYVHTETSDEQIAQLLTGMMGSPVILVPQLADIPASALSSVYVFANGVAPAGVMGGPLGFQPDVFDSAPGDEAYSPLRAVKFVTWAEGADPRVLRSVEEILVAEQAGEMTIEQPSVVVNMPFLTWPGGRR